MTTATKERGRPRKFDRDQVLRLAMEVFLDRGYDGASVGDLTTAMGINAPSLYAAFGCKEALFREALDLYVTSAGPRTRDELHKRDVTAREAIQAMLREAARRFGEGRGCLVVLGATHRTTENEAVFHDLAERRNETQSLIRRRLKQGVADGDVSSSVDISTVAAFYATVLNGLSLQARDGASRKQLMGVVDCAMKAWVGLVGAA
ncbi:TetR/AcrR family transcriptional regulator [Dyella sp. LX-66]|uniref:TetR/AcrR family transcriptional regulator n=1 Tax=unclassified Dyella TaxID=2634549 RepID=UPI001BE12695|nr:MULTISPECIES: TetR/AcrR family transcriptional regulator [unclassified Dyella]MBT2116580.1 TetR/AcrR family transcriptional regulator [Dyella sp. LX-1]MBT2140477.1 TetR/AcrR family transcriptional regulator [Dyella sp. LX-66]